MKILKFLLLLTLFFPLVNASQITPETKSLTTTLNNFTEVSFTLSLSNETCSPIIQTQIPIYGLPSFSSASGNFTVRFFLIPKSLGTFDSNISYCNSTFHLKLTVSQATSQQQGCPTSVIVSGSKVPGKYLKFDIRDSNYYRVKKEGTIINIMSSETGELYSIDCSSGSCTWQIPENEKGTLSWEVITPGCGENILTGDISLKMAGSLMLSVPSRVYLGDDFYIYLYDPTKGPVKYVDVQVFGPSGEVFKGKTNGNGILCDDALMKTYGIDIKPDKTGNYNVFATLFGYNPVNSSFSIVKEECPYECCLEEKYVQKLCAEGYKCENHACVKIEKPKLKLNCTPFPTLFQTSECRIFLPNGDLYEENVDGTLKIGDETKTVSFSAGIADIDFDDKGTFELTIPDQGNYTGAKLSGKINTPKPNYNALILFLAFFVVVIVVIIIWLLKRRKGVSGPKIEIESAPSTTIERVTSEK